jgi:hypothetical protein
MMENSLSELVHQLRSGAFSTVQRPPTIPSVSTPKTQHPPSPPQFSPTYNANMLSGGHWPEHRDFNSIHSCQQPQPSSVLPLFESSIQTMGSPMSQGPYWQSAENSDGHDNSGSEPFAMQGLSSASWEALLGGLAWSQGRYDC